MRPKTLAPGAWWRLPLVIGPIVWFGLPVVVGALTLLLTLLAVAAPAPLNRAIGTVAALASVLDQILLGAALVFLPVLAPALAFAAWLLRRDWLAWWVWGLAPTAFAAAVGGAIRLSLPPQDPVADAIPLLAAACGLLYGLAFRAVLGWRLRRRTAG